MDGSQFQSRINPQMPVTAEQATIPIKNKPYKEKSLKHKDGMDHPAFRYDSYKRIRGF